MIPTVLLDKRQLSRGFEEVPLSMAGSKHKRNSSPESEGLDGSPAHVDSEDSSAPKRKCISLNRVVLEGFDVPIEVFTLSKLSSAERKSLEIKLRSEVEKIQVLRKRLMSINANVKKQANSGVKRPGLDIKPTTLPAASLGTSHLLLMKQCEALLKRLMSHKHAWVFSTPVDVVKFNIPDYYAIIKHPMDLGTVKSKLASGAYTSARNFVADVRLTFTNAMTYNPPTNSVHVMADTLSKFFETRWKPIEKKLVTAESRVRSDVKREETIKPVPVPQPKKKRTPVLEETSPAVVETIKPRMTIEERKNLGDRLTSVSADLPVYIIDFLRQCSGNTDSTGEDELEIDIDMLEDDMMFKLQKLLDRFMEEKKLGGLEKNDMCEVEVLNVSGISNSSMHPCKVNEPMEEDVDIGGDDAPVTSYPPICIEKEAQGRGSKCSISSSSSDSGSSSSDSDSSSSSGDSHDRAVSPTKGTKENIKPDVEQEKSDVISSLDRPVSGLTIIDQDAQSKPESIGTNSNPEGESERQASPEKLYRAALLRSRFADTIVKAHEKLVTQGGEKGDPEKLRRAKEELERQQREEKARILAEAKAAEDARKRAEAEAEAEAKRKRELEREAAREAARQALLEIEKTAETNDAAMLRELDMLRTAPAENIGSSVDETSPDLSPDGLPDFMRTGFSNPLEQLGLFMKADEEEEEEEEGYDPPKAQPPNDPPKTQSPPVNDEEEGEIEID